MDDFTFSSSPFASVNPNGGVDYEAMNRGVTPRFFIALADDPKATEEAGAPRKREEERVMLIVAGDELNRAVHPVSASIIERFPREYEAWKTTRKEMTIVGTRLEDWPPIPALLVAEYRATGIFSVENLRDASDGNISRLRDGRTWRDKAAAWLKAQEDGKVPMQLAAQKQRLEDEVASLKAQLAELAARFDDDGGEAPKRGPGRPRKEAA